MARMKLRWHNVPIPEAYVAALASATLLQVVQPHEIMPANVLIRIGGALVLLAGVGLGVWSVGAAGHDDIDRPTSLLVSGPYRRSRNPMYVAWGMFTLGFAQLVNSVWLLVGASLAFLYVHLVAIPREEAHLDRVFGEEYLKYKRRVRRYL